MSAEFTINDEIQVKLKEGEIQHLKTGRTYPIGSNESELLKYFMDHPNEVLSRQVLIEKVWISKGIYVEDGSLMQTISLCRKALEDRTGEIIVTERGKGYRFSGDVTEGLKLEVQKEQEVIIEQNNSPKKNSIYLPIIFFLSVAISYFGISTVQENNNKESVLQTYYLSCTVEADELTFKTLYNVTAYEYKDKKLIIDNEGKSLSFPSNFEGVSCE
ncbi:winged helix-turn-helix domain-containing protein [Vibrio makurazakiensis]|uniref:winged helix-turn-helix domain-containing protein n=1 Tax=Vibrio makurazakiensis TaxID=2910250 RepID=UPI003D14CE24